MSKCTHDLAERETSCAWDGKCPICLESALAESRKWNERVSVCKEHTADIVDGPCVVCEVERLRKALDRSDAIIRVARLRYEGHMMARDRPRCLCDLCMAYRAFSEALHPTQPAEGEKK